MCAVLDDLVIALYVTVDELLGKRYGPDRPPFELVPLPITRT